ncbi:MAG: LemA family protein [Clostridia bacterium]|nr:LemA family protein [Clostridia bacterium]
MGNILLLTGGEIAGIVVGAVAAVLIVAYIIWRISTHNKFVRMLNQCDEAWSTIDIYLKKRFDLIPNLVETVKGYAKHEHETLTRIAEARAMVNAASSSADRIEAEARLTGALRGMRVMVESYPELKANTNFMSLQNQLTSIEGELQNARKYYNANVREFNIKRDSFPSSIVANKMRLEKQPLFTVDSDEERKNVKVQF